MNHQPQPRRIGVSNGKLFPTALRREFFGRPCAICGQAGDTQFDHIIPKSRGGTSVRENMQVLCRVCNSIKGNRRTNEQVAQWIKDHPAEHKRKIESRAFVLRHRLHWP